MALVLVEHGDDGVTDESLQAVTLARGLASETGGSLAAVAFANQGAEGSGDEGAAGVPGDVIDDLAAYGVADLYVPSDDRLDAYAPEAWASSVDDVVADLDPAAVVAPGTDRGQEVLAHVAAERELPMAANCLAVDAESGADAWELTRQRWGGSLVEHARLEAETKVLTTAAHEVAADPAADPADLSVHDVSPELGDEEFVVQVERREASDVEGVPLGEARVVVGGGRGVGSAEDFAILEELADELGAAVGSSRAAVNEGWRPHDDQIGQTGTKITPKLYIACGISGAVQHMVGCKGADNIMAINTDAEAAIIQKGEYAVIGDLHEVVPALTEAIRARTG